MLMLLLMLLFQMFKTMESLHDSAANWYTSSSHWKVFEVKNQGNDRDLLLIFVYNSRKEIKEQDMMRWFLVRKISLISLSDLDRHKMVEG